LARITVVSQFSGIVGLVHDIGLDKTMQFSPLDPKAKVPGLKSAVSDRNLVVMKVGPRYHGLVNVEEWFTLRVAACLVVVWNDRVLETRGWTGRMCHSYLAERWLGEQSRRAWSAL
jgi:hypothetical protein